MAVRGRPQGRTIAPQKTPFSVIKKILHHFAGLYQKFKSPSMPMKQRLEQTVVCESGRPKGYSEMRIRAKACSDRVLPEMSINSENANRKPEHKIQLCAFVAEQ